MMAYPRLRNISMPDSMYTARGQAKVHASLRMKIAQAVALADEVLADLSEHAGDAGFIVAKIATLKHNLNMVNRYANCLGDVEDDAA